MYTKRVSLKRGIEHRLGGLFVANEGSCYVKDRNMLKRTSSLQCFKYQIFTNILSIGSTRILTIFSISCSQKHFSSLHRADALYSTVSTVSRQKRIK